jgi:hypothetical protein
VESGAAVFFWLIMRHETLRPHEPHAFPSKGRGTTGEHARGGCLEDCGLRRKGRALSFRQEGQREGMRRAIPLLCPTLAPPELSMNRVIARTGSAVEARVCLRKGRPQHMAAYLSPCAPLIPDVAPCLA